MNLVSLQAEMAYPLNQILHDQDSEENCRRKSIAPVDSDLDRTLTASYFLGISKWPVDK